MSLWNKKFTPMLLGEVNKAFDDNDYLFEIKYDGIRSLLYISKDNVTIKNRYGLDITDMFPELKTLNKYIQGNVIFDGEIIMFEDGKVSFSKLQKRIHLKNKKTVFYLSKTDPVLFVCFDILYENKDLINLDLIKRKEILDKYLDTDTFVKSKYVLYKGTKLFAVIKKMAMEGIVAKKINSKYQINERSNDWLKIKNYHVSEFTIIGYINKSNSYVISLLLAKMEKGSLRYVGKVSIGKKRKLASTVINTDRIKPILEIKERDAIYIKPEVKCKVYYLERTSKGYLRHPFIP